MTTTQDLEQLDRIDQVLKLRLAEVEAAGDIEVGSESTPPSTSKAFESLSTKLLLWQNRLQEMTRTVKRTEASLAEGDEPLRGMLVLCGELKNRLSAPPPLDFVS